MTSRSASVILLAIVGMAALSGCSPTSPQTEDDWGEVSIADYSHVTARLNYETGTVEMPLDAVRAVTPEVANKSRRAIWAVTDACMAEHGHPRVSADVSWPAIAPDEDRLYGRWSTALASRFGAVPSPDTLEGFRIDTVARGVAYNSQLTPCWDGMQEVLAPELTFIESSTNVDYQVYRQAARATLDSPEGKAALQKRTTCMENEGVVVDPETSMPSSDYGTGERADETMVRVAVVAAQCSEQTGAIQQLYDLTARYQAAYIDQREAQFVALEEHATAVEARLDEVLRDPDAAWASRPAG